MNLKTLPLEIEKIIKSYYYQLERTEKMNPVLIQIKNIGYLIDFCEERQLKIKFKKSKHFRMYISDIEVIVNIKKVDDISKNIHTLSCFRRNGF